MSAAIVLRRAAVAAGVAVAGVANFADGRTAVTAAIIPHSRRNARADKRGKLPWHIIMVAGNVLRECAASIFAARVAAKDDDRNAVIHFARRRG